MKDHSHIHTHPGMAHTHAHEHSEQWEHHGPAFGKKNVVEVPDAPDLTLLLKKSIEWAERRNESHVKLANEVREERQTNLRRNDERANDPR